MLLRQLPSRTDVTELSDDELLLFDAIFECPWPVQALRRGEYGFHLNVRYTHGLSDEDLRARIVELVDRGLMTTDIRDPVESLNRPYCALTPTGGVLWELERKPDWSKYCSDSYDDDEMAIDAYCEGTALACMRAFHEAGWHDIRPAEAKCIRYRVGWEQRKWPLISWKESKLDYSIVVPHFERGGMQLPEIEKFAKLAPRYDEQRWWWRTITELVTLPKREPS